MVQLPTQRLKRAFMAITGRLPDHKRSVWVDSGCSRTISCNANKLRLVNLCKPNKQYVISGLGGNIAVAKQGNFPISLTESRRLHYSRHVHQGLPVRSEWIRQTCWQPRISLKQRISFESSSGDGSARLTMGLPGKGKATFALEKAKNLYRLPFYKEKITHICGVASHHFKSLTVEELWHFRMGHASARKIAKLSTHATGFSRDGLPVPLLPQMPSAAMHSIRLKKNKK